MGKKGDLHKVTKPVHGLHKVTKPTHVSGFEKKVL